jgi:rhodanese-related sulfurtransferase
MKRFMDLIADCLPAVGEIFPWDLAEALEQGRRPLLLDVREPYEFDAMKIEGSINVPRGILESAAEYGYEETVPELVQARDREVVVICRSGNRSLLAASSLKIMGFENVVSLRTGLRGWNDFEQPLTNASGEQVDIDDADEYFTPKLRPEQLGPASDRAWPTRP